MNSEFRYRGYWIPFPKPVPAVVGTAWDEGNLRTICVSEEWLPYILGALGVLARRETYFGDPADIEFSVEQANHILSNWRDECPMPIMFQQTTPCLLEYSLDGGTTWTGMYNGQLCINENIADGTLAAGAGANPSHPVQTGGCQDYYVQVQEQTDFILPTTVSTGDVITVSDVSGAWADGWLGNLWYCYDGSVYLLGVCISGSNPAKSGDPLQTAQHQQLIVKVGDTYYDPLTSAITVPSGVSNALVSLQPNNGSARAGGTGVVTAKVTVCNNSTWCWEWDFTATDGGFTYDGDPTWAAYSSGNGWGRGSQNAVIHIKRTFSSSTIDKVTLWGSGYDTSAYDAGYNFLQLYANHDWAGKPFGSYPQFFNTGATRPFVATTSQTGVTELNIHGGFHPGSPVYYTKLRVEGRGTNPFGSNNCA